MQKTLDYCTTFSRSANKEAIVELRRWALGVGGGALLLAYHQRIPQCITPLTPHHTTRIRLFPDNKYTQFEMAQLVNLGCGSPEEAKSLIPSLTNKASDVELELLLEEIRQLRSV